MNPTTFVWLKRIALISLVIMVLSIGANITLRLLNPSAAVSPPIAYNMWFADDRDSGKIYYYNGNHFVVKDKTTYQTRLATPKITKPIFGVSDVVWVNDGVFFKVNEITNNTPLTDVLNNTLGGPDLENDLLYWYIGFNDTQPKIGFSQSDAQTHRPSWQKPTLAVGNTVYYASGMTLWQTNPAGNTKLLARFDKDYGDYLTPLFVKNNHIIVSLAIAADPDGYPLKKNVSHELYSVDIASGTYKKLQDIATVDSGGSPVTIDLIGSSDHYVYAFKTLPPANKRQIVAFDLSKNQAPIVVLDDFTGTALTSKKGIYAITTGDSELGVYTIRDTTAVFLYRYNDTLTGPSGISCSDVSCLVIDYRGIAKLVSKNTDLVAAVKPAMHQPIEKQSGMEPNRLIRNVLSPYDNDYDLMVPISKGDETYKALQDRLTKQGIDSYAYTFHIKEGRY